MLNCLSHTFTFLAGPLQALRGILKASVNAQNLWDDEYSSWQMETGIQAVGYNSTSSTCHMAQNIDLIFCLKKCCFPGSLCPSVSMCVCLFSLFYFLSVSLRLSHLLILCIFQYILFQHQLNDMTKLLKVRDSFQLVDPNILISFLHKTKMLRDERNTQNLTSHLVPTLILNSISGYLQQQSYFLNLVDQGLRKYKNQIVFHIKLPVL